MNQLWRECKSCNISKSLDCYHSKQTICKDCRCKKEREGYNENKIRERIPYRNEFLRRCCVEGGMSIDDFNRVFIPFEKYEEMKKDKNKYSFCECSQIRKSDREHNVYEYQEKKYWLDIVMCHNIEINSAYLIRII
jgi:hypothetical protein